MPRWDARAEERLRNAALDLFLESGYENVVVQDVTERAGLTRRTFSRYFTDKRDVLFAGSEQLPAALGDAIMHADPALPLFDALLVALAATGEQVVAVASRAAERRSVISGSPELQERERTKFAAVADAVERALQRRGADAPTANLFARVGVDLFQSAFQRCTDQPALGFSLCLHEAAAALAAALAPARTQWT
ncbi:TetR family transcriptional regulator [Streptomyces sp. NPDC051546]|uniref:TetR family transcriptional regulator n=1 Tax=Streptomyces sp. NPDC051546 TaxID=3365655 RepID=UPI0037A08D16